MTKNSVSLIPFSSLYFKGKVINTVEEPGSCANWNSFSNTQLILPYDNIVFTGAIAAFGSYNFDTKVTRQENSTCSDPTIVRGMMDAIKYGYVFQAHCDGRSWRVFTCNSQRVICINCKLSCELTEACPGAGAKSFIINPCESRCNWRLSAYSLVGFSYTYIDLFPKYSNGLAAKVTNSSITLFANLTAAGRIYCAAYESGQENGPISLARINLEGVAGFITTPGPFSLVLGRLSPATQYQVYCYTEDYKAHIMPIATVLANRINATTGCCRFVSFTSPFPQMNEFQLGKPFPTFTFQLSTRPTSAVSVRLNLRLVTCDAAKPNQYTKNSAVSPSIFNFTQNSPSLVGTFAIQGYQGCFKLLLTTASANKNETYGGASANIVIVNAKFFRPAVPVMTKAIFSNDGQSLYFYFSSPTNMPMFSNQTIYICIRSERFGRTKRISTSALWDL